MLVPIELRQRREPAGITRLPNGCGLSYKVLGNDTGAVKQLVRRFCSDVRQCVKGRPLPVEFSRDYRCETMPL